MNITLDFRNGNLGYPGVDRLRDAIGRMGPDGELTIMVNSNDAHETDMLVEELQRQGFDYQPKGSAGNIYNIIARRHLLH
ncbi:MAG: hypothetical protein CVU89_01635 [Firmicutes bacterium HGW-Firmicutes-14]|nr:MAG: hypothetical protein CVU89_01635 [Firmicutes bacterium HGW-Firmicutes-14]